MNADNKFGVCCKCPARMEDGRIFTNYMSQRKFNNYLFVRNNFDSSHDFRHFLQNNASTIMKQEVANLENTKKCSFAP